MAITSTVVVLVPFASTMLVDEPAAAVALAVILLLGVALDIAWLDVAKTADQSGTWQLSRTSP